MNNDNKDGAAERIPDDAEGKADAPRGITRFAQYSSPIMLAMLVSAGQDMALAQSSVPAR